MSWMTRSRNRTVLAFLTVGLLMFGAVVFAVDSIPYVYVGVGPSGQMKVLSSPDDLGQQETLQVLATKDHIVALLDRLQVLQGEMEQRFELLESAVTEGLDELESALRADLNAEIDALIEQLTALEDSVDGIEDALSLLANRVSDLEAEMDALDERIGDLEADVITLNDTVAMLQAEINEIRDAMIPVEPWLTLLTPTDGSYTLQQRDEIVPIALEMLDQFGQPLPDGTLVRFFLGGDEKGSLLASSATTVDGVATVNYKGPSVALGGGDIITIETGFGPGPSVSITIPESKAAFDNIVPGDFTVNSPSQVQDLSARLLDTWGNPVTGLGPVYVMLNDMFIAEDVGEIIFEIGEFCITDGDGYIYATYKGPAEAPSQDRVVRYTISFSSGIPAHGTYWGLSYTFDITVLADWN